MKRRTVVRKIAKITERNFLEIISCGKKWKTKAEIILEHCQDHKLSEESVHNFNQNDCPCRRIGMALVDGQYAQMDSKHRVSITKHGRKRLKELVKNNQDYYRNIKRQL